MFSLRGLGREIGKLALSNATWRGFPPTGLLLLLGGFGGRWADSSGSHPGEINTVISVGAVITVVGIVGLTVTWFLSKRTQVEIEQPAEVFAKRQGTQWYGEQLKDGGEVWVMWNSASFLRDNKILEERFANLKRVVFPDPDGPAFSILAESSGDSLNELQEKVRASTDFLLNKGVEVRWHRLLPASLITGCKKWLLVETYLPRLAPDRRPQYRVMSKGQSAEAYRNLSAAYDKIWSESTPQRREAVKANPPASSD